MQVILVCPLWRGTNVCESPATVLRGLIIIIPTVAVYSAERVRDKESRRGN